MRRATFALVTLCVAVAGCREEATSEPVTHSTRPHVAAAVPTGTAVRVVGAHAGSMAALTRQAAAHLANTGLTLDLTTLASDRELLDAIRAARDGERGPYDLALIPHRWLGAAVRDGLLVPREPAEASTLSPPLDPARDFFDGWWRRTAWFQGQAYGYPLAARAMSLWKRGDFWDEEDADAFFTRHRVAAGPPATWTQFSQQAAFQHRPEQRRYGTVVAGREHDGLATSWLQIATSFGGRLLDAAAPDEYGDIVVNSAEARRATEFYLQLLQWSPPGAAQFGAEDVLRAYQSGIVAMTVLWHDLSPRADSSEESSVPMRSGYEPVPSADGTSASLLETLLLVRLANGRASADVTASVGWLLSHDAQRAFTLSGGFSARPSVYEDAGIKRHIRRHMWTFPNLVTGVVPLPSVAETPSMLDAVASELSPAIAGTIAPGVALDRLALALERMLAGRARLRYPPRPERGTD